MQNFHKNHHSAIVIDKNDFTGDEWTTKKLDNTDGILLILGKLNKDDKKLSAHSYKFPKDNYTTAEAKQWLKDNNIDYIAFKEANEDEKKDRAPRIENPYKNYHAAKVRNQDEFKKGSFKTIELENTDGIKLIIGTLKGEDNTTEQSYRIPKDNYTVTEAKQWLKDNGIEYIEFEPATGQEDSMQNKSWYEIKNIDDKNTAEINIYDEIGFWGIRAKDFINDFQKIKADYINVYINSPGGDVFDGIAIYNILSRSEKAITVFIDGLAASIASVIAMAGDTIKMSDNSLFMIHNPMGFAMGESDDMIKLAEVLEKIKDQIITIYENRTGLKREAIAEMMDQETWMDAKEAGPDGNKFIDEIIEGKKIAAFFDLEKHGYKNGGKYKLQRDLEKKQNFHAKNKNDVKIDPSLENSAGQPESEEFMNKDELKAKHPELFNEIFNDGKNAGIEEGKTLGAKAEADRINAINDLGITGHDEILKNALADGKSSAADVALAVVKAEKGAADLLLNQRIDESDEAAAITAGSAADQVDEQMDPKKIDANAKQLADIVNSKYQNN